MASSSERNTEQEYDLSEYFTMAFARLHYAGCHELVQHLAGVYGELLDMDQQDLMRRASESKIWRDEASAIYKYNRPSKIFGAAALVHETAQVLWKKYGREEESVLCFGLASTLHKEASWHNKEEELRQARERDWNSQFWVE